MKERNCERERERERQLLQHTSTTGHCVLMKDTWKERRIIKETGFFLMKIVMGQVVTSVVITLKQQQQLKKQTNTTKLLLMVVEGCKV